MRLKDKTVFITGASAGIGEASARAFAAEGAKLILAARRMDRLKILEEELKKTYNVQIFIGELDVRVKAEVETFIASLPSDFREIDILVNNAGLARGFDPIQDGNIEDWDEMIDTNIKGLLYVTRAIAPRMVKCGKGHIINIGSIAGRQVYPKGGVYCATKFAVHALNQSMLIDLVDTPIRITTVDPGLVKTEFAWVRFRNDDENAQAVYEGMTPLRAEDIAETIVFCATRPAHVNIAEVLVLPTDQASAYHVHREIER